MSDPIPAGFFVDAVNPTEEEILRWANVEDANYPPEMEQDWDLCLVYPSNRDLLLQLACDLACPNRKFFLHCLYLMIGDYHRSTEKIFNRRIAKEWLGTSRAGVPSDVNRFFGRSKDLIEGRIPFDYTNWCSGGFAYAEDDDQAQP